MTRRQATIHRAGEGVDLVSTLHTDPEIREIVIAQGKEFRNDDSQLPWSLPAVLALPGKHRRTLLKERFPKTFRKEPYFAIALNSMPALPLLQTGDDTFEMLNLSQGVLFKLSVINTKFSFVSALTRAGVHLIYAGHARYGRGPCFGAGGHAPGDDWEDGFGTHPNDTGIFRMGFPFIAVPVEEILKHAYHTTLVTAGTPMNPADCDPSLRPFLRVCRARPLARIHPDLASFVVNADPTLEYWTYGRGAKTTVVLHAGWQNTASSPDDLGALEPTCRVFCHFGCSTFDHNHPVLRKLRKWRREGNERYAYFTTKPSDLLTPVYWLQALLTYSEPNAFASWGPSLEFAVRITNRWLGDHGSTYRVI